MKPLLLLLAGLSLSSAVRAEPPSIKHQTTCAVSVGTLSRRAALLLKNNDMRALSRLVDAKRGLRISPEPYISKQNVRLSQAQVASARNSKTARVWGTYDGEGGDIRLNWNSYRKRFVWPRDFSRGAQLTVSGKPKGQSTIINNLHSFYAGATLVELYLPPTSPNASDWNSLWLVWRKSGGTWRLIGIANNQWST